MRVTRGTTRRVALERLAILCATPTDEQDNSDGIQSLCKLRSKSSLNASLERASLAAVPMSARELDVLLALCKAAPLVTGLQDAEALLAQLAPYMPEAHRQVTGHSAPISRQAPWESLAYELTSAVLSVATNHSPLAGRAHASIEATLNALGESIDKSAWRSAETNGTDTSDPDHSAVQLTVAMYGFMRACANHVQAWNADQRLALIQRLRILLSEKFMVSVEGSLSAIRNGRATSRSSKEWRRWIRQYATQGKPLGAMLLQRAFIDIVERIAFLLHSPYEALSGDAALAALMAKTSHVSKSRPVVSESMIGSLAEIIAEEVNLLDEDADYLQVSSAWQQRLAFEVKAATLRSFLYCTLIDEEIADDEVLMSWLEATASNPVQMGDGGLAEAVLKSMAILAGTSPAIASTLSRTMPRLIVQGKMPSRTGKVAGECLAHALRLLSGDVVISTLYSLGNVLSAGSNDRPNGISPWIDGSASLDTSGPYTSHSALGSSISLNMSDEEESTVVYGAVIQAIVAIAIARNDEKISALVLSMLVQKLGRINPTVDARLVAETAALGAYNATDLKGLLRLYVRAASLASNSSNVQMVGAVTDARIRIAASIRKDSPLYEIYLVHLLGLIVGNGDERAADVAPASRNMARLFRPLAILVSTDLTSTPQFEDEEEVRQLGRDAWFNIVAHGFTLQSQSGRQYAAELQVLAQHSLPLIDEERVDMPESGIELNPILRRSAGNEHVGNLQAALIALNPQHEAEIKKMGYAECVYLNAATLVTTLRARAGDCTSVLPYFLEHKVKTTSMGNTMLSIATNAVDTYLQRVLTGREQSFAASQVALQLVTFFEDCCHRISSVQNAAVTAADRIINAVPSALCHKASLFALLELLTIMWRSCLDAETDEYEWKTHYTSEKGLVSVQLSDDVNYRQTTLTNFHRRCRIWVSKAVDLAPLDMKGLLRAYLEDYEDEGTYGHIGLGRSFAVEMGARIPASDQRLTSIDRQSGVAVNTASDFMAQITTRQAYRHGDSGAVDDDWTLVDRNGTSRALTAGLGTDIAAEVASLRELHIRLLKHEHVPFEHVRDSLRRAAACLTTSGAAGIPLVREVVAIPFIILTKQSIKLGISLWLGIVKENPALEHRVLAEVATGWESSVRLKKGFFNSTFAHLDPFYVKEEFAPTNWEAIAKRQQVTHDLIAPHLRLIWYLKSHFNASRLTAPNVEKVYARLMRVTMTAMQRTVSQPLAREVHFHLVLLALDILQLQTRLDAATQWRSKDAILSGALAWFATAPLWSFGSNRLQLKAEVRLLADVSAALQKLAGVVSKATASLVSLQPKQELLQHLLAHESGRLSVWISPLGASAQVNTGISQTGITMKDTTFSSLVRVAWLENPSIAIHLTTRFPHSQRLNSEVKALLLAQPEKAISEPDALYVMIGSSLPTDLKNQLKYLLYWAPVNPMAAVAYFMPAYHNNALITQYAIRALESHAVEVTFFYVPQIVQTLRYDALGYVERYIIETAKFSQLFAHQIIWNMKANAYKDDDQQVPDPVKPTLDKAMNAMISSWSPEDRSFYETEFEFFAKVTGISGTLKPFITAPKAEKKAKIEEELRKIEVQVGVYLPSNPDGVVIGIDRKSGKPLQSHAKAPYMATFRIRKEISTVEVVETDEAQDEADAKRKSYETWQSAIFKVGDDCRQDVLALQMIAAFRGIFNSCGLDVYVFPYRVTATAPGCGVIDVLPNSISRDMMGREAVNGLYEYFVSKYGYEDSLRFQTARGNFVKSMAAYSIISYLLQFKDRHNGNIMVDDAGHILHIDFGFCFDIAPGGVKFERAPFKLTPEMVAVMGGSVNSAPFRAFEELCVKVFLAARQHVEQLSHIVQTMLDSGLPCFKPQTLHHFKERFVLEKSEREAAEFVRKLVKWSAGSYSTGVYDYFQLLTNGIPY
nr:hypothetical protein B0A51_04540 [Rachicladosporium sp. CCFEE 5018]